MNTISNETIEKPEENPETQDMVEALAITLDEGIIPQDGQTADEPESGAPRNEEANRNEGLSLPAGVTPEPQDPEHMDLTKVTEHKEWVYAYIKVSDDEGHLLNDLPLETEVKALCAELDEIDLDLEEDPDFWVSKIKDVTTRYASQINFAESISTGSVTKYRIRMGKLLIRLKYLVKKKRKQSWVQWFKENYDQRHFRSVQDYMGIAEIPNVIRYAVFGKERLLEIIRQLGDKSGADPIGDFLSKNGIDFNPETELDPVELRIKTDVAIGMRKLAKERLGEVSISKVEALVRAGMEIETKHIMDLKAIKKIRGDLNARMDQIIGSGGKVQSVVTPEGKAKNFRKTVDKFISLSVDALLDGDYLREVDLVLWRQLKAKIEELEPKVSLVTKPGR